MREISRIIIHCTDTPLDTTFASIKKYHLSLGYSDIGYHFVIDKFGNILDGRPLSIVGAHCLGYNFNSIGVALIGGNNGKFDFTSCQLSSLSNLVHQLCHKYNISLSDVKGHNEFNPLKSCPNFNVKNFFAYESK